jgi:hypothetical protein
VLGTGVISAIRRHIAGLRRQKIGRNPHREFFGAALSAPAIAGAGPEIPVLIPFNTVTYVRGMVRHLRERGMRRIVIVDNASTYGPMCDYLATPEDGVKVLRLGRNEGPRHFMLEPSCLNELPDIFCLTDPDLLLNPDMPPDFLDQLLELTERMTVGKAGLALEISNVSAMRQESFFIGSRPWKIWEWEDQFWQHQIGATRGGDPVYSAEIDTTFPLYNKRFFDPDRFGHAVRVGGRFTCRHRPWYLDNGLPGAEEEFYKETARDSYYLRADPLSSNLPRYEPSGNGSETS